MNLGYLIIVGVFVVYYFSVLITERKLLMKPNEIMDKFLSVALLYAGVSIIYYSITGQPFLHDTPETYNIYIFIIGFISLMWAIPNLLMEFKFFEKIARKSKIAEKKRQ